ncbi:MAG TPA: MFS transporter, partial [Chroococcales cyanobacterium]
MNFQKNSFLLKSAVAGSLGGLLFGFDTAVISGTTSALTSTYALSAEALGITVSSALWGTVISSMTSGMIGEKFGSRETLRIAAILYVVSALGCGLAWNWHSLLFFRIVGGLAIGCSSVLGPVYIAELAPADWRGRLVGLFQINIVIGILVAYFSNGVIAAMGLGAEEWRWKLGIAAAPALLFFLMLFGIPRSPRWLVTQNCIEEAKSVLIQLGTEKPEHELEQIVNSVQVEHDQAIEPLFRKKYWIPICLAISTGIFNQLTGINAILYYLNDIFARAGFNQLSGDMQAVAVGATNLLF